MYCHQEHDDIILPAIFTSTPWWSNNRTRAARSVWWLPDTRKNPVPVGSNQRIGWLEAEMKNVGITNVLGGPNNLVWNLETGWIFCSSLKEVAFIGIT